MRAVSVLPFQATTMFSPSRSGGAGGAIRSGRPVSNSAVSSAAMLGATASGSGRPTTTRSKMRPRLPSTASALPTSIRQSAASPSAAAALGRARAFFVMKASKVSRARSARSRASRSKPATRSGAAATKPSAPAAMMSGWPGRTCRPSR